MRLPRRRSRRDAVERYLRRLSFWAPRSCRHDLVAEAERHLYDATRRWGELGLPRPEAQRHALRAFGPAWRVGLAARGLAAPSWLRGTRDRLSVLTRPLRRHKPRGRLRMRRLRLF